VSDPPPADPVPQASLDALYAPVLGAGLRRAADRIEEMHQAIARHSFDPLQKIPGLAVPTRIVQGVHDAIAQGVYAAVRHGSGAAFALAGQVERLATDTTRELSGGERILRNALNGAAGDALAQAGSGFAITMGLYANGRALDADAAAHLRPRCVIFLHGLACDEQSWCIDRAAWADAGGETLPGGATRPSYGTMLEAERALSAVFLRYNSGLSIADNARRFDRLLDGLAIAAPQVREWVLVGHSMGGLVAREACAVASAGPSRWLPRVAQLICLGSPHQGAPLEQLGELTSIALGASEVTKPIGRIGAGRSRGIKDLRHGLQRSGAAKAAPAARTIPLRLIAARLGSANDGAIARWFGNLVGDGLVSASSAVDHGRAGDVERVELDDLGHMALLQHPRVLAELRRWIA